MEALKRLLEPLSNRINSLLSVGVLRRINSGTNQTCQVELLEGELRDKLPHHLPYGHASVPLEGAEPLVVFLRGDKSGGIVVQVSDPRYQPTLEKGESALHDDQGQIVHIKRDGILVRTSNSVEVEAPNSIFNGDVTIKGTLTAPEIIAEDVIVAGKSVAEHMKTHS